MRLTLSLLKSKRPNKIPKVKLTWPNPVAEEGAFERHPGFSRSSFNRYPVRRVKPLGFKGNHVLMFGSAVLAVTAYVTFYLSPVQHIKYTWFFKTNKFCPDLNVRVDRLKVGEDSTVEEYKTEEEEEDPIDD